jgi:predicted HicB family RNase H-like nuclease
MPSRFNVALSGDFLNPDGEFAFPGFDIEALQRNTKIQLHYLENCSEITADQTKGIDALFFRGRELRLIAFM